LIVSYTERGDSIRIISAREVTRSEREMLKKDNLELEDKLRPEYDLKSLKVRKSGPRRKSFSGIAVCLEPDSAIGFDESTRRLLY
jgi:hypothetical protein